LDSSGGAALSRLLSTSGRSLSDARWDASPSVRDFFGGQRRLRRGTFPGSFRWKLPPLFLPALELGLWQFLGTAFQALGLEHTSATRAGFVVQTTNVLVPIISFLSGDSHSPHHMACCSLSHGGCGYHGPCLQGRRGGLSSRRCGGVPGAISGSSKLASAGQAFVDTHPLPLLQEAQRRLLALAHPDVLAAQAAPIPGALIGDIVEISSESSALSQGPAPSAALALASVSEGAVLGDIEVLCGALFYSLATVRLSRFLRQHKPYELSAATMVSAAFAGGWALLKWRQPRRPAREPCPSLRGGWTSQVMPWDPPHACLSPRCYASARGAFVQN